jgi:hypothetical protein
MARRQENDNMAWNASIGAACGGAPTEILSHKWLLGYNTGAILNDRIFEHVIKASR